jgi:hypothetical protein
MRLGLLCFLLASISVNALALADMTADSNYGDVTYDKIVALIGSHSITSLDELLALLPSEYRSHYTLAYKSESLQCASATSPRVVMYGDDAKTVLAFNGDPKQCGYNQLEVMQFNTKSKQFEFHEISFPAPGKKDSVHFSQNSQKCAGCHADHEASAGLRPNWSEYPNWPGFYGENDDDINQSGQTRSYDIFLKRKKKGRYKFLTAPAGAPASYPYDTHLLNQGSALYRSNSRLTFLLDTLNTERQAAILLKPEYSRAVLPYLFATLRCNRDAASIKNMDKILGNQLEPIPDNILDDSTTTLLAGKIVQAVGLSARDWSTRYKPRTDRNAFEGDYTFYEGHFDSDDYTAKRLADHLAAQDQAFKNVYDPSTNSYYKLLAQDITSQNQPKLDPNLMERVLAGGGALGDSNIKDSSNSDADEGYVSPEINPESGACPVLRKLLGKLLGKLSGNEANSGFAPCASPTSELMHPTLEIMNQAGTQLDYQSKKQLAQNPTLKACASCHVSQSNIAPQIPFNDPLALQAALHQGGYTHGTLMDEIRFRLTTTDPALHMPQYAPTGMATDKIETDVMRYLSNLLQK